MSTEAIYIQHTSGAEPEEGIPHLKQLRMRKQSYICICIFIPLHSRLPGRPFVATAVAFRCARWQPYMAHGVFVECGHDLDYRSIFKIWRLALDKSKEGNFKFSTQVYTAVSQVRTVI
eukprot:SAG31_NODE_2056_length_6546_cov_1.979060_2_plen_118_part_00